MTFDESFERRLPVLYGLVAIATVGAAVFILPSGPEQRLQQLLADRNYLEAKAHLDQDPAKAMRTERGWADAIEVNRQLGEIDSLGPLVGEALATWSGSEWPRAYKAEIVATLGSFEERIVWAEAEFARAPRLDGFTFLVGAMQGQGNSGREAEILERGIDLGFAGLAHVERLAYIRAAEGEAEAAIGLLTQVVETSPNPPAQARLTLFSLMVENGQVAAAVEVAVRTGLDPDDISSRGAYIFALREEFRDAAGEVIDAL
jgi:hypothetical protein